MLWISAALAIVVVVAITAGSGTFLAAGLGLPDAGVVATYGPPVVRVLAEIAAALTVGALLLAAVIVPPQLSGYLDGSGYRSVRAAAVSAAVWAAAALLMVALTAAESLGRPLQDVLAPAMLKAVVPLLPTSMAWLLTAALAVVVLIGCCTTVSWGWTSVLLGLAVLALLPVAATGHSAVGVSHDIATGSLMLHVVAAALWVGGLVAVLALAVSPADGRVAMALPRYSLIATWCWALMVVSGVVNLIVRVPVAEQLLGSRYGALAGAKAAALLLLGGLGYAHRRWSLPLAARGDRIALLRLGGVEVLVMFATFGLAVGLGRTPPPPNASAFGSRAGELLGYDLPEAPDVTRLLLGSRLDVMFAVLVAILLVTYLAGVRRVLLRDDPWPPLRIGAWASGCIVILLATSSGIGRYGAAMLSIGVASQVLLSLVAPFLLVLGAPLELARRALPARSMNGAPSPRGSLLWVLRRPLVRRLAEPVTGIGLFVGSQVLLYTSGLFAVLLQSQTGRLALDLFRLLTGWLLAGVLLTRLPQRLPSRGTRWSLTALLLGAQTGIGAALLLRSAPIGEGFYRRLALPWVPALLPDQRLAAIIWLLGQLALVVPLISWLRAGPRLPSTTRFDGSNVGAIIR
ncbi:cytochrome c oxidase assembly protein [Pseudonocardia sp.]|jgi:putative copper resistance protein D|uniref:cytochrome c oxidase assembly protein n=1 Tax=Pseudonocardia sp. TaxID=60912 RepID=UPI0031FD1D28